MKSYLFVLLLLISYINSASTDCNSENTSSASSSKDWVNLEKSSDRPYCCYVKAKDEKGDDMNFCTPLTKQEYDDIDKTIKEAEIKVDKIDCKSYYIEVCLLSLLFLFI